MKIGFDLKALRDPGGVGTYSCSLLQELVTHFPQNDYFLLYNSLRGKEPVLPDTIKDHVSLLIGRYADLFPSTHYFSPYSKCYPKLLKAASIDIFHGLFSMPVFSKPTKSVVTLHDITPVFYPELFSDRVLTIRLKKIKAALQSDHLITPSFYSKKMIQEYFAIPDSRISVVYQGFTPSTITISQEEARETLKKTYHIEGKILLNVSVFHKYKNKTLLVDAFNAVHERIPETCLVLGGPKAGTFLDIQKQVKSLGLEQNVFFTGTLSPEELQLFYRAADVFVFPSLAEGFGLPVLEAMDAEVPVIISNTGSLSEISGDAALSIDPGNRDMLASTIEQVLTDSFICDRLRKLGKERTEHFSWKKTARETMAVYEKVLS